ncbi:CPBP family intramembrane glutamic endopeptidase [Tumebacillus permanentifrigoris]|uniref:Membrane protease YdiL (CAAX protease family) n=1 Tax=Tumebacillus permanentifrigoris TaxID=378543 RepID=A0A316DER0_9BACL|nr:CPBP family intramembrane glutamic endopeptidase [Tumebacillus permanentifrigoris]PWK16226.1 membrane protease YdiL (CAAX protease family) [Tumebacillus permanentifrigoris]
MKRGKSSRDKYLWVAGILGILLFLLFTWLDPSATETHAVDQDQALAKAIAHWQQAGLETQGLKSTVLMDGEQLANGYLSKNHLRDLYDTQLLQQAPLVYWKVTLYPASGVGNDHFEVRIDPDTGAVVAWSRSVNTSEPDPIEGAAAKGLAQQALQARGFADAVVQPVAVPPETRKPREVPVQTFEYVVPATQWAVGDLQVKYNVSVTGQQVSEVSYAYLVPAEFLTWHERQERIGMILTGLSLLFSFGLTVLAFVYLFLISQKKPWWSALGLGVLTVALFALANLNELPTIQQQFLGQGLGGVGRSFGTALVIFGVVVLGLLVGAATYVLILTGGMLTKEVNPALWTPRRARNWSAHVRGAMWRGYLLAFAWLGLQGIFYLVAEKGFGVWYEEDFSMSPSNMWFPLLFPLMAWLAGIQEETTYRLFGVTFFKRYWKNSLVACLLPAMIWALGHSLYSVYPIYTRFIELSMFGVVIGYCYLWWGIETVIFAHVVFDTIQMVIPFLLGGDGKEISVGVLYLLLPIVVGYALHLVRTRNEVESDSTALL